MAREACVDAPSRRRRAGRGGSPLLDREPARFRLLGCRRAGRPRHRRAAPQPTAAAFDFLPLLRGHWVEARDEVAGLDLAQRRHLARATRPRRTGTGLERARARAGAACPADALDRRQRLLAPRRRGRGIDWSRPSGVGMPRAREELVGGASLHERARAYMTVTRSQFPATTPRSCVMSMSAVSRLAERRHAGARGSAPGW